MAKRESGRRPSGQSIRKQGNDAMKTERQHSGLRSDDMKSLTLKVPGQTKRRDKRAKKYLAIHSTQTGGVMLGVGPSPSSPLAKGEVLVRLLSANICQADVRYAAGAKAVLDRPDSVIMGHDAMGTVVASQHAQFAAGDHVVFMPHLIPDTEVGTAAFREGNITRMRRTDHAGMGADGFFAQYAVWPGDYLIRVAESVVEKVATVAAETEHHWSQVVAETEHVACAEAAIDKMEEVERSLNSSANLKRLRKGGKVLIVGAGYMGFVTYGCLKMRYPSIQCDIREPNEHRAILFQRLAAQVCYDSVNVVAPRSDADARGRYDLVIMATSNRAAVGDVFLAVKKARGHVMLFSGIDNAAVDPVVDPLSGTVNLERVHRIGGSAVCEVQGEDEAVVVSGTSGYTNAWFCKVVETMPRYAKLVATSITGTIVGLSSDTVLPHSHTGCPKLVRKGSVAEALLKGDVAEAVLHMKISILPNATMQQVIALKEVDHA